MTLSSIRSRGELRVAVSLGIPGLSQVDAGGVHRGLDADFARAVAISILGDAHVRFVPVAPADRLNAVLDGRADLGCCNLSWTLRRSLQVSFVGVLCHDAEGILVPRRIRSSASLDGRAVVVQAGSTSPANLRRWRTEGGPEVRIVEAETPKAAHDLYVNGDVDGYVLDRTALAGIRAGLRDPHAHHLLSDTLSAEPLSPYVAPDSGEIWRIAHATLGLLVSGSSGSPLPQTLAELDLLGEQIGAHSRWATGVVSHLGSHAQLFDTHLGAASGLSLEPGPNRPTTLGGALLAPSLH